MEDRLNRFNDFLDDHWIDLLIPDDEFRRLSTSPDEELDEFGDRRANRRDIDLLFRRKLYRVFNDGTFEHGGRFYGGWWQGIQSRYRRFLTINGLTTAELDFSNMQIAMLYAMEGRQLEGDAYALEGVPAIYRGLLKRAVFKIINARGQIRAPRRDQLPPGWDWRQIREALEERHQAIRHHFRTGIGIRLQRRDADIAERVMHQLMEQNVLALPVHDSFIVRDGHQPRLREAMLRAFREELGREIAIDEDERLFPELPHDAELVRRLGFQNFQEYADAAANEGLLDYEEHVLEVEMRPEYTYYRQRRLDFLNIKGENWGYRYRGLR
ncbi:hypothetical protein [Chelativorans sp. YIM 93263]|uniref:hypothetical protein n=1 Tax=Chelativorans sp. YIM 93263 TaxID=2906648 RepID=UPI002378FC5F|nr:hypothetical protein [Chelativorans sp. YIM 93263]